MKLFHKLELANKAQLPTILDKKPIPNKKLRSSIELYERCLEPFSEEKTSQFFRMLPLRAVIVYLDVVSLFYLGNTQKLAKQSLKSTQCIMVYDQIYNVDLLFYLAAYNKLIDYINRYYFELVADSKQSPIGNNQLSLYQVKYNHLMSLIDGGRRTKLNNHLQNIFEILSRPEAQVTGCVILLEYIESIILDKQEDIECRRMLANFFENTDFFAPPTEPKENIQILKTDQAFYARQVFFRIKKTAKNCPHPARNFSSSSTVRLPAKF